MMIYTSSSNCKKCLTKKHNETVRYSHQVITPTLVSPLMSEIIPLMPEFIRNEDGSEKQDCEINASKRWLKRVFPNYRESSHTRQAKKITPPISPTSPSPHKTQSHHSKAPA